MRISTHHCLFAAIALLPTTSADAYHITEKLSLSGVLSGAVQCQKLSDSTAGDDTCKSAVPFQPRLNYYLSRHDRLFLKLGFAAGNGLNEVSSFNIPSWGAALEDDVKNINGSGRDYVLEAWYKHDFVLDRTNALGITLGIIDATQYLDQNAYANDEFIQFMNTALSNAPNTLAPSYDLGIAAEWLVGQWIFSGVIMDVHQDTSPENYSFYGFQSSYRLESRLGIGNYRILLNLSRDYVERTAAKKQENDILIFSADQQLGNIVGVFTRIGWRLESKRINYRAIYSGGIDIKGAAWGRTLDNIGVGLACLEGGDNRINNTKIAEAYYRTVINPHLSITGDLQYLRDEFVQIEGAEGFIYSLRATVVF